MLFVAFIVWLKRYINRKIEADMKIASPDDTFAARYGLTVPNTVRKIEKTIATSFLLLAMSIVLVYGVREVSAANLAAALAVGDAASVAYYGYMTDSLTQAVVTLIVL